MQTKPHSPIKLRDHFSGTQKVIGTLSVFGKREGITFEEKKHFQNTSTQKFKL
jgi:hypothetical protein